MKLPEKIYGRNRIRDGAIIVCWAKQDMSTEEIAEKFKLTQRRIEQILRANHAFVTIDKEWEKKKRIHWLKSKLKKAPDPKKDSSDLLDQLRVEIEGNRVEHTGKDGEALLQPVINVYAVSPNNRAEGSVKDEGSIIQPRVSV